MCVGHTGELCKTAEPIEMSFGGQTRVGARNLALDGVQVPTVRVIFKGACAVRNPGRVRNTLFACPAPAGYECIRYRDKI